MSKRSKTSKKQVTNINELCEEFIRSNTDKSLLNLLSLNTELTSLMRTSSVGPFKSRLTNIFKNCLEKHNQLLEEHSRYEEQEIKRLCAVDKRVWELYYAPVTTIMCDNSKLY
jgi:hypothetical protein